MKILVIGGTSFVGRTIVETLIKKDLYEITLFNRGKTNPGLFPELKLIKGDRETDDINQLKGLEFDVAIDVSGRFPRSVEAIAKVLKDSIKKHVFVSTCSMLEMNYEQATPLTEETERQECSKEELTDKSVASYNPRKAECERLLEGIEGLKTVFLRPGLVIGPYDPTDRLYYWLYRVKHSDKILIPDFGDCECGLSFAPDFAEAVHLSIQNEDVAPIYNAVSYGQVSISDLINNSAEILNKKPELISVDSPDLSAEKLNFWIDIPLWLPGSIMKVNNEKVRTHLGLKVTPLKEALNTTINYYDKLNWPVPKYGISIEKEREILEKHV